MITIVINDDYGVQTSEFDILFTATNTTNESMLANVYVGSEMIFNEQIESDEDVTVHIPQSVFDGLLSIDNKIHIIVFASNDDNDYAEKYVSFMKLVMPTLDINDHLGIIHNIQSAKVIYLHFNIKDIISPTSQRGDSWSWNDVIGILAYGIYIDNFEHLLPVPSFSTPPLKVTQIQLHDSRYEHGYHFLYLDANNLSIGEHTIYIVYSMVRGNWDETNPQDPSLYDNYAIVQKEVKIYVTEQDYSWSTPKTTWHGEAFNAIDYNRIKGNLIYLHSMADRFYNGKNLPMLGNDKTFVDYYFSGEFNAFEDELEDINKRTLNFDIGEKQIFYPLGKFIGYEECNRIENAQLRLYERLNSKTVSIPYAAPLVYSGMEQTPMWISVNNNNYTKSGDISAVDVGSYTTVFTLDTGYQWEDGTTEPKIITWSIGRYPVHVPTVKGEYIFDKSRQNVQLNPYTENDIDVIGDLSGINVGIYSISYHLNNANYEWFDGTTEDKTDTWEIKTRILKFPVIKPYEFIYDGTGYHIDDEDIENFNYGYMTQNCTWEYSAGDYSFYVTLRDTSNTCWEDGSIEPIQLTWTIQRASVAIPTIKGTYTYNYREQYVEFDNYDSDIMQTSGEYSTYDAGTFTPIITITSRNYQFTDGTTKHEYTWIVERLVITTPTVMGTYIYDGDEQEVEFNDYIDYAMSKSQQYKGTNAGSYTARIDITSVNFKFSDEKTYALIQWSIGKANGYVNLSATDVVFGILTEATIQVISSTGSISVSSSSKSTATAVYYSSSNTIKITGKSEGTATINVTFAETSNYLSGQTAITVHCGYSIDDDYTVFRGQDGTATVANKTLFAGGANSDYVRTDRVIAISNTLTKSTGSSLPVASTYVKGMSIGDYAIFAGGLDSDTKSISNVVAYDRYLTATLCEDLYSKNNRLLSAKTPNYVVFGFGSFNTENIDAYNSSLTHTYQHISELHNVGYRGNSISIGNYAVFAGGNSSGSDEAIYFDNSLTKTINNYFLSTSRISSESTEVGNYGLFAGGYPYAGGNENLSVDVFNSSLTRSMADNLKNPCTNYDADAVTVGNHAIFIPSTTSNAIEIYDNSLIHTTGIAGVKGVSGYNSDYALFHDPTKWIAIKKVD